MVNGSRAKIRRGQAVKVIFRRSKILTPVATLDTAPMGVTPPCSCLCGDSYIGETGRTTNTRVKEHKAACRLAHFEKSAVAEHAWKDGHIIEWDQVTILDTASDLRERQTKEALYIKLAPPGCRMNRDEGKDLSPLWLNAIKNSEKGGHRRGREAIDGRGPQRRRPHPPSTPPPNIRRPTPTLRTRRTSHATATTTQADAPP